MLEEQRRWGAYPDRQGARPERKVGEGRILRGNERARKGEKSSTARTVQWAEAAPEGFCPNADSQASPPLEFIVNWSLSGSQESDFSQHSQTILSHGPSLHFEKHAAEANPRSQPVSQAQCSSNAKKRCQDSLCLLFLLFQPPSAHTPLLFSRAPSGLPLQTRALWKVHSWLPKVKGRS